MNAYKVKMYTISQAYCTKENENKEVDTDLLIEIHKIACSILDEALKKQREICADEFIRMAGDPEVYNFILNAPEPRDK